MPLNQTIEFSLCKECTAEKSAHHSIYKAFELHSKDVYVNPRRLISSALGFRYKMNDEFIQSYCKGHFYYEKNTLEVHLTNNTASRSERLLKYNVLRRCDDLRNASRCFDILNIDVNRTLWQKFEQSDYNRDNIVRYYKCFDLCYACIKKIIARNKNLTSDVMKYCDNLAYNSTYNLTKIMGYDFMNRISEPAYLDPVIGRKKIIRYDEDEVG